MLLIGASKEERIAREGGAKAGVGHALKMRTTKRASRYTDVAETLQVTNGLSRGQRP